MSNLPPLSNRRDLTWLRMFRKPLQRAYRETHDATDEDFERILAANPQAKPDMCNNPGAAEGKAGKES